MWNLEAKKPKAVYWTASYWVLVNLICLILRLTRFRGNSILVRYEDLCGAPDQEMRRILNFIGLEPDHDYSRIPHGVYHNIAGNHARFSEDKKITLDQRWITGLTSRDKLVFAIIGGWLNLVLGFGIFRGKGT